MLVSRAYTVMDTLVVEISCVHGGSPATSHLLIREERRGLPADQEGALRALCDVADVAASLTRAARSRVPAPSLAECEAGWAIPSD